MHTYIQIQTHTCTHVNTCRQGPSMRVHTHTYTYTHLCIHTDKGPVCGYTHTHTHTHTCAYTQTRAKYGCTHTHTHIHTLVHTRRQGPSMGVGTKCRGPAGARRLFTAQSADFNGFPGRIQCGAGRNRGLSHHTSEWYMHVYARVCACVYACVRVYV